MRAKIVTELMNSIQDVPTPPCETCKHFEKCKKEKLACDAFGYYVARALWSKRRVYAPSKDPTRSRYLRLYCE